MKQKEAGVMTDADVTGKPVPAVVKEPLLTPGEAKPGTKITPVVTK